MIRTRVGYSGGSTQDPTYRNLADHTESLQIDYHPEEISYSELLEVFWEAHNPIHPSRSRQYMSAIFYHHEDQKRLAEASKSRRESQLDREVYTQITPLARFYRAEDYHQKYYLRGRRNLMEAFKTFYPDEGAFIDSTAAARVNGYLGGHGLPADLEELSLPHSVREILSPAVGRRPAHHRDP